MRLRIDKIWLIVVALVLSVPSAHAQIVTANPLEWMALAEGKTNRVICSQAGKMVDLDIVEGLAMKKSLDSQQYEAMEAMTGIGN